MKKLSITALVTGASTGIGKAIAIRLSSLGYSIIATARNEAKLKDTQKEIFYSNGECKTISADLSNDESVQLLISEIRTFTKHIDLIVNVAGVWHSKNEVYANIDFENFKPEIIEETMKVGIVSPMLIVNALLPIMPKASHIVNISGTFENGGKGSQSAHSRTLRLG